MQLAKFQLFCESHVPIYLNETLILLSTYHNSTHCLLKPLAKMRLTLVLSLAVLATHISGLALPTPPGKNSLILPERDFLERGLADNTILKGNEGAEKRHEHEHGGFKKSKRSPVIDFPDGGDRDGGVDNIKKSKRVTDGEDTVVVKARRSAVIDFPDGDDSDAGVDNIKPPPDKISKRIPTIDFPDGGDSDGGVDNIKPPVKVIERDV
jgi:hypothetical protein